MSNKIPPKISGAIFDLDGVILYTMEQWNALGINYLQENGIRPSDDVVEQIESLSLRESAELFHSKFGVPKSVELIKYELIERLKKLYAEEAEIKEGALDTLRLLKSNGVGIALATSTSRALAINGLRKVGALQYFDKIFSCRDANIDQNKTNPKVYDVARTSLGIPIEETVVIEDALYAIETAKKASYYVIAVEDAGERKRKETIMKIADLYVKNHAELCRLLQMFFSNSLFR